MNPRAPPVNLLKSAPLSNLATYRHPCRKAKNQYRAQIDTPVELTSVSKSENQIGTPAELVTLTQNF